jgi:Uma2 family endonuclease
MVIKQHLLTIEEFEGLLELPENADRLLELIDGELVEKMPTEEHGIVTGNILAPLHTYAKSTKSGRVGTEIRHRKPEDNHNSRLPDVSFSKAKRPIVTEGNVSQMPDLAVEVQSPDDSIKSLRNKAAYYLANGSKMVWLVYPSKRLVEVYIANGEVQILLEDEILSGGDVLPGFELPVKDIFADPMDD